MKDIPTECKKHGKVKYVQRTEGGWRCSKCASESVAKRRRKVKDILIAEAGGKCQICGYDKCPWVLQFHHRNPNEKAFGISQGGFTHSLAKLRAEVKKCDLLCANCHAEIEYEKYQSFPYGVMAAQDPVKVLV